MPDVYRCGSLHDLLPRSDILSLHVPFNAETRGMIGAEELALLPKTAVIVNTSRGKILDEMAVIKALKAGHLAGACLDVMCDEQEDLRLHPSPLLQYARKHTNLLITPHIGGATHESMARTEVFIARKLVAFLHSIEKGVKALGCERSVW